MSCKPRDYEQQWNDGGAARKKHRRETLGVVLFGVAVIIYMVFMTDRLPWVNTREGAGKNWKQMSGNDGKFWRGIPDNNAYAGIEGAELRTYYQYSYDRKGRLSGKNTFHHHDNYRDVYSSQYRDVWVLSNAETFEYDEEGRISRRNETQGDTRTVYEYTEDGHIERSSWSYAEDGKISKYDLAGNRIYFRNADNYRFPHVTTWEYDEKNRPVRKTLEVEGKEPYGVPAYVTWTAEYDEEKHTSVETEYGSDGEITYIWHCVYDKDWNKSESCWYAPEKIPEGYLPEECEEYYTKGYWAFFLDGKVLEKMENKPWKESRNDSEYTACNYDSRGNLIMELKVYSVGSVYLYRYVYDGRNRLTEQFDYNFDEVRFWEQRLFDDSKLTLQVSDDEVLSITRTGSDGTLLNRFAYGEHEVEAQQTPGGIIFWQQDPSLLPAEKESRPDQPGKQEPEQQFPEETESEQQLPEEPDSEQEPTLPEETEPEQPDEEIPSETEDIYYMVKGGDCLWSIAEGFLARDTDMEIHTNRVSKSSARHNAS